MIFRVTCAAFGALFLLITSANAKVEDIRLDTTTYVGVQGIWAKAKTASSLNLKDSGIGFGFVAGWRAHQYVGLEIGYEQWANGFDSAPEYRRINKVRTLSGDLYAYYPMLKHGWLQPFVTIGIGLSDTHARQVHVWSEPVKDNDGNPVLNADGTKQMQSHRDLVPILSDSRSHLRAGAGVEFTMFNGIAGRLTGRYQAYKFGSDISDGLSVSLALLVRI
jgi:opacity protein-like surface antigen